MGYNFRFCDIYATELMYIKPHIIYCEGPVSLTNEWSFKYKKKAHPIQVIPFLHFNTRFLVDTRFLGPRETPAKAMNQDP